MPPGALGGGEDFNLGFLQKPATPKEFKSKSPGGEMHRLQGSFRFRSPWLFAGAQKKHKKIRGSLISRQARVKNNAARRGLRWSRWDSPWKGPRGKQQATPSGLVRCPPLEDRRGPVAVPTPPGTHTNARPGHPPTSPVSPRGHPRCGLCHLQASLVQNPSWAHTHP